MTGRRVLFAVLFAATMAGSLALAALALSPGGLGVARHRAAGAVRDHAALDGGRILERRDRLPDHALFRRSDRGRRAATSARIRGDEPMTASTAILLCIRNEAPERMIRNLEPMLAGLDAAGCGGALPSLRPERHQRRRHRARARRRASPRWPRAGAAASRSPTGGARSTPAYKAGNIRDFCERWGSDHEFAVTLDADSFMTADADPASGAHHAGRSQARHPAGPGRRPAVDQRLRARLPVRHAARHALLHHRQRLVAGRLRTLLGPQRGDAAASRSSRIASFRSCPSKARPTAISSATTRSRRR